LRLSQLKVYTLQGSNREHTCFTSTTLTLNDHIPLLCNGKDGPLLDR
jgi:hypothetical protein